MPEPTHSVVVPTAGRPRPPLDPVPWPTSGLDAAPPTAAALADAVRLPFATHLSRKSGGTSLVSATWLTSYPHRPAGIQRRPENSLTVTRARPPSAPPDRRRTPPQARGHTRPPCPAFLPHSVAAAFEPTQRRPTVLVACLDSSGEVLLSGPAVRAVAGSAQRVVMLTDPRGSAAARMLPGVDRVIEWRAPWTRDREPGEYWPELLGFCAALGEVRPDAALVFTSAHQSPLPLALLLRLTGVPWIGAISMDDPGNLLDLHHQVPEGMPEAERLLSLVEAAGYRLRASDSGRLAVRRPLPDTTDLTGSDGYVAVHVGGSAPARRLPVRLAVEATAKLAAEGIRVVVTGAAEDKAEAAAVAEAGALDLAGRTSLPELADVVDRAAVLVVGNTAPAHLAAAVQTPVVSLFAPVVPASAWAPYGTRLRLLGDQNARCAGSRARACPVPGHPCLNSVTADEVVQAVHEFVGAR